MVTEINETVDGYEVVGTCGCGHWKKLGPHDPSTCAMCSYEKIKKRMKRGRKPSPPAKETELKRLRREVNRLRRDLDKTRVELIGFQRETEARLKNLEMEDAGDSFDALLGEKS